MQKVRFLLYMFYSLLCWSSYIIIYKYIYAIFIIKKKSILFYAILMYEKALLLPLFLGL